MPVTSNVSSLPIPAGCVLEQVSQDLPWTERDRLLPTQVKFIVQFAVFVIPMPLLFITSCSTNILSMVVFYKQGLKERINMCLFSLSLVDMLYVIVAYGGGAVTYPTCSSEGPLRGRDPLPSSSSELV
ncbi:hypothetical protein ACOMHN_034220 [Nucella lapillus]